MKFTLVKQGKLSGARATVYTVKLSDGTDLFDQFLEENIGGYHEDINDILQRLRTIATKTGAQKNYFKLREGKPGDGVSALYDSPKKHLRLYCVRMGNSVIILGGGGPKTTRTYQEDPKLNHEANLLKHVSKEITDKMNTKYLRFSDDELELEGELVITP